MIVVADSSPLQYGATNFYADERLLDSVFGKWLKK